MKSRQIGNTLINAALGALCGRPWVHTYCKRRGTLRVVRCGCSGEHIEQKLSSTHGTDAVSQHCDTAAHSALQNAVVRDIRMYPERPLLGFALISRKLKNASIVFLL